MNTLLVSLCVLALLFSTAYAGNVQANIVEAEGFSEIVEPNANFISAFLASFSVILTSEIGDKTFFIAAIMAMTNGRQIIFLSAIAALAVMTVLSVFIGLALPALLPKSWTHIASCILFTFFGIKLLVDAYCDDGSAIDEMHEVEEELAQAETAKLVEHSETDLESSHDHAHTAVVKPNMVAALFPAIAWQCFSLTFLAEWGDRSQISTIALAASKDPYGVCIGGILGHSVCTGIAVISGKALAYKISERMMQIIGGSLFLIFAVTGFYSGSE